MMINPIMPRQIVSLISIFADGSNSPIPSVHIITSSIVILFVLAVSFIFEKKISPCIKYSLWLLVAVKLLLPFPEVESKVHILNFIESPVVLGGTEDMGRNQEPVEEREGDLISDETQQMDSVEDLSEGENGLNDAQQVGSIEGTEGEENSDFLKTSDLTDDKTGNNEEKKLSGVIDNLIANHQFQKVSDVLLIIYFSGVLACGGFFLVGNICFGKQLRKNGRYLKKYKNRVPMYRIEEYYGACLYGGLKPVIIVGNNIELSIEQQHMILTHEYVHYIHGDHVWSLVRCACIALHWYNPLVWIAAFVSRRDGELACDEGTLKRIGKKQKIAYGQSLLEIAKKSAGLKDITSPAFFYSTTAAGGKNEMKKRITMIARGTKTSVIALITVVILSIGCIGCTLGRPVTGTSEEESDSGEIEDLKNDKNTDNQKSENDMESGENTTDVKKQSEVNSENSESIDEMAEKYNLYTEPQRDKVCIRVAPSEVRKQLSYYYIPTGEEQEELKQILDNMEVVSEEKRGDMITELKTGKLREHYEWSFVYNEKDYSVYDDYHFSSFDLENKGPGIYYEQNQKLYEKISSLLIRDLNYETIDISTIRDVTSATLEIKSHRTNYQFYSQTITDSESLKKLEQWFGSAKQMPGEYDCGNNEAAILLETSSGEEIRMSLATDDCAIFAVNGVYYDYEPDERANEGWNSNNVYELFNQIPNMIAEQVLSEEVAESNLEIVIEEDSKQAILEVVPGTDSSITTQNIEIAEEGNTEKVSMEYATETIVTADDEVNVEHGKFLWPTTSTTISTNFGTREHPVTGEKIVVDYIGIAGEEGDSVYAVTDGTITDVGFDGEKGNYIVLTTEDGKVITYGHLMGSKVPKGAEVTAGEIIGLMGKTGMATGTFLSLSVYDSVSGNMEDPMTYLQ